MAHSKKQSVKIVPISLGALALVFVAFVWMRGDAQSTNEHANMMHDTMSDRLPCTVSGEGHGHTTGTLTALFEGDTHVGWQCMLSSHHVCTTSNVAPKDGEKVGWGTCTYEPSLGWPDPVPTAALENPEAYRPAPLEETPGQ